MITFNGRIVQFGFGAVGKSFFEKLPKEIKFDEYKYYVITKTKDEFPAFINLGGVWRPTSLWLISIERTGRKFSHNIWEKETC